MSDYQIQREEKLLRNIPLINNEWIIPFLYEYLVEVNYDHERENIALKFFEQHLSTAPFGYSACKNTFGRVSFK